jgi:hypothetical protein
VALVRTDISERLSASFITVTRTTPAAKKYPNPDERGAEFLRNVGSYKSHMA